MEARVMQAGAAMPDLEHRFHLKYVALCLHKINVRGLTLGPSRGGATQTVSRAATEHHLLMETGLVLAKHNSNQELTQHLAIVSTV